MATTRRKFTVEQKLHLLREAEQEGITQTLRKHNLSHSVFIRWRKQLNTGGAGNLQPHYPKVDPEKKNLELENARLKKIIANQALELEFKTELLKKAASLHPRN
ncbi:MAG TPA: transposase [Flavisolibacter sp.]|nr:transposase [Flavisolibacter sp.]